MVIKKRRPSKMSLAVALPLPGLKVSLTIGGVTSSFDIDHFGATIQIPQFAVHYVFSEISKFSKLKIGVDHAALFLIGGESWVLSLDKKPMTASLRCLCDTSSTFHFTGLDRHQILVSNSSGEELARALFADFAGSDITETVAT